MTGVVGADLERLRALATTFDEQAQMLRFAAESIDAAVGAAVWAGPDAETFTTDWHTRERTGMLACADALEERAKVARANADAQEAASAPENAGTPIALAAAGAAGAALGAGLGPGPLGAGEALGAAAMPPAARDFLDGLDRKTPQQVNAAWAALDDETRAWLIHNKPVRIGNLDGVPFTDRDKANRREMNRLLAAYDRAMDDARARYPGRPDSYLQPGVLRDVGLDKESLAALRNLRRELREHPEGQLASLDVAHEGAVRAAFSLGNLDTATNVGVYVPGISSRISSGDFSQPEGNGKLDALDKMDAIRKGAGRLLRDAEQGDLEDVAQVYWLDYSAPAGAPLSPDIWRAGTALTANRAEEGGANLAGFANGLDAVNSSARTTVMAHSYGSVTAGYALPQTTAVDSIVVFGSPGIDQDHVLGYLDGNRWTGGTNIPPAQRWYGKADGDLVARSGWHGEPPEDLSFNRLPTEAVDGYEASHGHSEYIDPNKSFQVGLAAVLAGHPERIPGP